MSNRGVNDQQRHQSLYWLFTSLLRIYMTGLYTDYLHHYYTYYMTGLFTGYLHPYYTYYMTGDRL
jgi:hypothetical protein